MNRIKELREKNNLTLRGLGKEINMSSSRISQYETGKREPKLSTWQTLANFFMYQYHICKALMKKLMI